LPDAFFQFRKERFPAPLFLQSVTNGEDAPSDQGEHENSDQNKARYTPINRAFHQKLPALLQGYQTATCYNFSADPERPPGYWDYLPLNSCSLE
jgi:hypothetical protein